MTELQAGSVTVADLYREIVGMRNDIGNALTRVELLDSHRNDVESRLSDHETRIRLLERFRYTLAGVSVVSGAVSAFIGYLIGHTIH